MPERIIRPTILTSDRINSVSWAAEVFYRRLMSVVDDYGRFDGRESILRAALYPLKLHQVSDSDVSKWMSVCSEAGLVRVYSVDSKPYVQMERFAQRLRATTSKYPAPADIRTHPHAPDGELLTAACIRNGDVVGDGDEYGGGISPSALTEFWNSHSSLQSIKTLSADRKRHLSARAKEEYFINSWKEAIARIAGSQFCTGTNDRGWRADVDWFLKPGTIAKVMEGKYDNKERKQTTRQDPRMLL